MECLGKGDAFPQTNDVALVAIIHGDTGVASLDVYAGNGSSSPDVVLIWQVAPVSSLHIPPTAVVGRLPPGSKLNDGTHINAADLKQY